MSRGQKIGPISKEVRNLVRDRLKGSVDDTRFKQGFLTILKANKGIGNLYSDSGEALARWVANYVYLIAPGAKTDWSIVMGWARHDPADDPVKKLCHSQLDFFFELADQVDVRIRQDFMKYYIDPMSK